MEEAAPPTVVLHGPDRDVARLARLERAIAGAGRRFVAAALPSKAPVDISGAAAIVVVRGTGADDAVARVLADARAPALGVGPPETPGLVVGSAVVPTVPDDAVVAGLQALDAPEHTPRVWVRVAGTKARLSKRGVSLLGALGEALAAAGVGIVAGRHDGVDQTLRANVFVARAVRGEANAGVVVAPEGVDVPLFPGERVARTADEWETSASLADLLFVFPGGEGTEGLIQRFQARGKPVMALPKAGGKAHEAYLRVLSDWEKRPVPGLTRTEYAALAEVDTPQELAPILRKVLDALARVERPRRRAVLSNDLGKGTDLLGIERQAQVFAEVITARDLDPPLAIGLFGDWGAGKSFFMGRIEEAVDDLAQAPEADPHGIYCRRVCQLRFNAWHYMDSHLWASLAGRVFDGIAEHLGVGEADPSTRRKQLRLRLQSSRDERKRAEEILAKAQRDLEAARGRAARLEVRRAEELRSFNALFDRQARAMLIDEVKAEGTKTDGGRAYLDVRASIATLALAGATPEMLAGGEGAAATLTRARSVAGRLHALLKATTPSGIWWLVPIALVTLPLLATLIEGVRIEPITGWLAEAGLVGLWVLNKGRVHLDAVERLVVGAETLSRRADGVRTKMLRTPTPEQELALAAHADAEARLADAQRRASDAARLLSETEAALADIEAGKLVYDFVRSRTGEDSEYRRREGIVSLVRRDLEHLRWLLADWRAEEGLGGGIDRIVLYIDDLDRCPAPQVVEVLQAVHLLLAFDLFVVVVGVDARWLERALAEQYPTMLGELDGGGAHHASASAHDYLEKIFQVPFTLPDMEARGFDQLLRALLPTEEEALAALPRPEDEAASSTGPLDADPAAAPAQEADPDVQATVPAISPVQLEVPALAPSPPPVDPVRMVVVEDFERRAMERLHPFLRTPRAAKRFANVYRLLRVSVEEDEVDAFLTEGREGEHRAVQLLLAVNCGFPRVAAELLLRLTRTEDTTDWPTLVADLPAGLVGAAAPVVEECDRLHPLLVSLLDDVPESLEPFQRWAPRIGRYSFYWRG